MRIVHGSDWHALMRAVPEADLYVFTGDFYDNYPVEQDGWNGWKGSWDIVPHNEVVQQTKWAAEFVADGGMRPLLGSPDAPILLVRGNHDFIDLGPIFVGCNVVHEFIDNELIDVLGLKATGHQGIPYIYGGWNDEVRHEVLLDRVMAMPPADLFLTHYPPAGILDSETRPNRVDSYGLEGMAYTMGQKMGPRSAHFFGHIHGSGGKTVDSRDISYAGEEDGFSVYSNAATTFNVIDL